MRADADLALGAVGRRRVFEDVAVGDRLGPLRTPVLSTAQIVRWSAAIENWHRIHYDRPFAVAHDGLPDVVVPGTWKQQVLYRLVKDWAGPDGWVAELAYQLRGIDVPGVALTASGRVSRTLVHRGLGFVRCEVQLAGDDGRVSAEGTALVVLPRRAGPPVPYPLPAEALPPDDAG